MAIRFNARSWRKSSYSGNHDANCIEVAAGTGAVGIRDSKDHGRGPILVVPAAEYATFVQAVADRKFAAGLVGQGNL